MKVTNLLGFVLLFTVLDYENVSAQEKPSVIVLNPKSRQGTALKDKSLDTNIKEEKEIFCVEDGIVPLKQPDGKEPSGYPTLNFGDTFTFVDTEQVGNSVFYLLTKGDASNKDSQFHYVGWVNKDALLLTSECLKDEITQIQKKALLIVKNKPGSFELKGTPRWTNSSANGTPLPPLTFYSIMFCYKKRNGFTLLGFQGKFKPAKQKNDISKEDFWTTMAGWVPDESIEEWNTREALKWNTESTHENYGENRRLTEGQIFNSRKDAINSRSANVPPGLVELKDDKNQSPAWPKDKMRYPIFHMELDKSKDQSPREQSEPDSEGGLADTVDPVRGRLFRIGVIGDFINNKGEVVIREEVDRFRSKLDAIKTDLEYTEILVVIDASSSMDMWLNQAVPQWIERIVMQSQKKQTHRVRISACLYRDIDDQAKRKTATSLDEAVTYIPWEEIKERGNCALVQKLKEEKAKDGGDPCEQMVHGLKFGLTEASKDIRPHSRKLVVLIGDMGNHVANNGPQNLEQDIKQISKLMVPENGTPWEMLAIQVPNSNAGAQADYQLFRDQAETICEAVRGQIDLQNKELAKEKSIQIRTTRDDTILKVVNRENLTGVLSELETQYEVIEKKLQKLTNEVGEFARGTRGGAGITPALEKIMAQENIDYKKLTQSGLQVFNEGWVWEKDKLGKPQIQIQVLLTSFELENLKNHILNPIIDAFEDGRNPENIIYEKMADELNALQTGEKMGKNTYKNIMAKRFGLTLKSKLFDIAFEINDKGEFLKKDKNQDKKSDQKTDLFLIYKKSLLIGDAFNKISQEYTEEKATNNAGNILRKWKAVGDSVKNDRFFKQPGASTVREFIWIDGETEFP